MFQNNISLKSLNTFGINAIAEKFAEVDSVDQLLKIISKHKDFFILSGGSNILLTQNISKPVIHLVNKGIDPSSPQGMAMLEQQNNNFTDQNNAATVGALQFGVTSRLVEARLGGVVELQRLLRGRPTLLRVTPGAVERIGRVSVRICSFLGGCRLGGDEEQDCGECYKPNESAAHAPPP